jgi:MCP family monocarboxylic acid transporter-like MFS transporter 10
MLSLTKPQQFYQIFLTQGVGVGLSLGFLFLPALSILSHHFTRKQTLAMGLVASGSSSGGIVFPILINKMLEKYGFAWATRITTFVCLGFMTIALACMRTRPPPQRSQEGQKQSSILDLFKDVPYVLAVLSGLAIMFGIFFLGKLLPSNFDCYSFVDLLFLVFYLQLYAITKGVEKTLAYYTLTILNGASIFGRILPTLLVDIVGMCSTTLWFRHLNVPPTGVYNGIIFTAFACGVITLATLAIDNAAGVVCLAIFYGFFSGAYIGLLGPLFASLSRSIDEIGSALLTFRRNVYLTVFYSLRMGLAFAVLSVGGLTGNPLEGALLTGSFHWERPIIFAALCFFVGTVGLVLSRLLQARRKGTWKV